jgi:lysophospholipase L1-like esterase
MLIDAGVAFDFVGSIDYYEIGNPAIPDYRGRAFDYHHEARTFYQTNQIAGQFPAWLNDSYGGAGYTPDIALIHAGTNDALLAQPAAAAIANLQNIVATLRQRNPRVHVLLAKIIPTFSTLDSNQQANANVSAINALIDALAATLDASAAFPDSRVLVVDHNTDFLANHTLPAPGGGDTYDGVHPSPAGEEKMARRWFEALQLFLLEPWIERATDGSLVLGFLRPTGSTRLTYRVLVSGDLLGWQSGAGTTETLSVLPAGSGLDAVRTRDLGSGTARFMRLELDYAP